MFSDMSKLLIIGQQTSQVINLDATNPSKYTLYLILNNLITI